VKENLVEKIVKIKKTLDKFFPKAYKPDRTPVEQAVFTVLSQNTTDKQAENCLENLKRLTSGNLKLIPLVPKTKVLKAIKPCGLYSQKYEAIISLLSDWDSLEKKLKKLPPKEGISLLKSFPFVGPKTARVILIFGFNKNAFPIDTHCRRVLKRLGVFPESWSSEKISRFMEENFDLNFNRKLHYDLIRIGRKYCKPKMPKCSECPLKKFCAYSQSSA
jgi:endonuclease-3